MTFTPSPNLTEGALYNTAIVLNAPVLSHPDLLAKARLVNSILFSMQQSVTHGVSARMYVSAVDKALAAIPSLVGPVIEESDLKFVYANGSDSYGALGIECNFGYELGLKNGHVKVNLAPEASTLDFGFRPGNLLEGAFNIDIDGTHGDPYATVDLCGLWSPEASPTLSASRLWGGVKFTAAIEENQLIIKTAEFNGGLAGFHIEIWGISWFLDLIGLEDEFNNWLHDIAVDIVKEKVASTLPGAATAALRDKLNYGDSIEGLAYAIKPSELVTSDEGITVAATTTLSAVTLTDCPNSNPSACVEPTWPAVAGRPDISDNQADAGAAIGLSAMNQGLFAAWRGGILQVDEKVPASEVLGAILPGFAVEGEVQLKAYTEVVPKATFAAAGTPGDTDPVISIKNLVVKVSVPGDDTHETIDITMRTELSARAIVEITPPFIGDEANPDGNRVQFRMEEFDIGTTTATYGPGSALLTQEERSKILNDLVLPMYREKVGILPLSSSVLDFKLPGDGRRAALKILRKQRLSDALAVYVKFDISPLGDETAPVARVLTVEGVAPPASSREVLIAKKEAIVGYTANDDLPVYEDYLTFDTSLGGGWTARNFVRAVKLSNLQEGTNLFKVRARDFANNVSVEAPEATAKIVVDTLPPTTQVTNAPNAFVNTANVTVAFNGQDTGTGVVDFMVNVDGTDFPFGTAHSRAISGLGEGPHNITVKSRDRVGHVDPTGATAAFTVDLTAPRTALTGARTGYTKPNGAKFSVLGDDNFSSPTAIGFSMMLEGPTCATTAFSEFQPASVLDFSSCQLADGEYKLTVRARDEAGNVEEIAATRDFVVDGKAPTIEIMETPPARSTDIGATFVVMGQDNVTAPEALHYMYRVRGLFEEFSAPVQDPTISLDGLPGGDYIFEVTALDLADNKSAVRAYAFSVDNSAPITVLNASLPDWLNTQNVSFDATGEDDRTSTEELEYLVTIDNSEIITMTAPLVLNDVPEGRHTVRIAAKDKFGNVDPAGITTAFSIDRTPPETNLVHTPSRLAPGTFRPTVEGTDNLTAQDELRYTYRVIRGASESEWSEPVAGTDVAIAIKELGHVKIEIAAVDNAGIVDPTPVELAGEVKAVGGCACSSGSSTDDLASFAAFAAAALFFFRRRNKR